AKVFYLDVIPPSLGGISVVNTPPPVPYEHATYCLVPFDCFINLHRPGINSPGKIADVLKAFLDKIAPRRVAPSAMVAVYYDFLLRIQFLIARSEFRQRNKRPADARKFPLISLPYVEQNKIVSGIKTSLKLFDPNIFYHVLFQSD